MPILFQLANDYLLESSVLLGIFLPQSSAEREKKKKKAPVNYHWGICIYILYSHLADLPWWEREGGVFTGQPCGMTCVDCCDVDMFTEKQVFTRCVHATESC